MKKKKQQDISAKGKLSFDEKSASVLQICKRAISQMASSQAHICHCETIVGRVLKCLSRAQHAITDCDVH